MMLTQICRSADPQIADRIANSLDPAKLWVVLLNACLGYDSDRYVFAVAGM